MPTANVNQNPGSTPAGQPTPFQNANFWNLTISGSRPGGASFNGHTNENDNDGCEMRNGFAGSINNALIFNTGSNGAGVGGRQALDLAGGGVTNWTTDHNTDAGRLVANAVTCNNTQFLPALPANRERTAFANGSNNNDSCISGVNDPGWRMNDDNPSFTPTGVAGKLDASLGGFDLRPSLLNATMGNGLAPSAPPRYDGHLPRRLRRGLGALERRLDHVCAGGHAARSRARHRLHAGHGCDGPAGGLAPTPLGRTTVGPV